MFDKMNGIVAAMLGRPTEADAAPTPLALAAGSFAKTCAKAMADGGWDRGGEFDPAAEIDRLQAATDRGAGDVEIASLALDLVDQGVPAIANGEWRADGTALEALIELNTLASAAVAANDSDRIAAAV